MFENLFRRNASYGTLTSLSNLKLRDYDNLTNSEKEIVNKKSKEYIKLILDANVSLELTDGKIDKKIYELQDLQIRNMSDFEDDTVSKEKKYEKLIKSLIYYIEYSKLFYTLEIDWLALSRININFIYAKDEETLIQKRYLLEEYKNQVFNKLSLIAGLKQVIEDERKDYIVYYSSMKDTILDNSNLENEYEIVFGKNNDFFIVCPDITNIKDVCYAKYLIEDYVYNHPKEVESIINNLKELAIKEVRNKDEQDKQIKQIIACKNKLIVFSKYGHHINDDIFEDIYCLIFETYVCFGKDYSISEEDYFKEDFDIDPNTVHEITFEKIDEFSEYYSSLTDSDIKEKEYYQKRIYDYYYALCNKKSGIFNENELDNPNEVLRILVNYIKDGEYSSEKIILDKDRLNILLSTNNIKTLKEYLTRYMGYLKLYIILGNKYTINAYKEFSKIVPLLFKDGDIYFNYIPNGIDCDSDFYDYLQKCDSNYPIYLPNNFTFYPDVVDYNTNFTFVVGNNSTVKGRDFINVFNNLSSSVMGLIVDITKKINIDGYFITASLLVELINGKSILEYLNYMSCIEENITNDLVVRIDGNRFLISYDNVIRHIGIIDLRNYYLSHPDFDFSHCLTTGSKIKKLYQEFCKEKGFIPEKVFGYLYLSEKIEPAMFNNKDNKMHIKESMREYYINETINEYCFKEIMKKFKNMK